VRFQQMAQQQFMASHRLTVLIGSSMSAYGLYAPVEFRQRRMVSRDIADCQFVPVSPSPLNVDGRSGVSRSGVAATYLSEKER
jgi:hypothetical protein